jgi:hypothetical protein
MTVFSFGLEFLSDQLARVTAREEGNLQATRIADAQLQAHRMRLGR